MFSFETLEYALVAGVLISIANGIVGSFAMCNRMIFLSGSIAHLSYGGIGLSVLLGINLYIGTTVFVGIFALLISYFYIYQRERFDTYNGIAWSFGMSLGVICFSYLDSSRHIELEAYMFGDIKSINDINIFVMLIVDLIIVAIVMKFYNSLIAVSFDIEFAKSRGINVNLVTLILVLLISFTVLISIKLVGLLLIMSLVSTSTYIVESYSKSFFMMMVYTTLLNILLIFTGLVIAYYTHIETSGVIITLSVIVFVLNFTIKRLFTHVR